MGKKVFYTFDQMVVRKVPNPTHKSFKDLTGTVIDKLTVVAHAGVAPSSNREWWCVCNCNLSKYFKVVQNSIKKRLTTSCGCNRKRNGKGKDSLKEANSKVTEYTITSFNGWEQPSEGFCNTCNTPKSVDQAYAFRQTLCCSGYDKFSEEILTTYNYVRENSDTIRCKSCDKTKTLEEPLRVCHCVIDEQGESPSSVYLLKCKRNPTIFKIGKGDNPWYRSSNVIASASENSPYDLMLDKVIWVKDYKSAYHLESLLHQSLKKYRGSEYVFDGSTEIFTCDFTTLQAAYTEHNEVIESLTEGVIPLKGFGISKSKTEHLLSRGIEFKGIWYPFKSTLARKYGHDSWKIVSSRLRAVWSLEKALTADKKETPLYEIAGVLLSLEDHCKRVGTSKERVQTKMIRYGESLEEALLQKPTRVIKHTINGVTKRNSDWWKSWGVCPKRATNWISKKPERDFKAAMAYFDIPTEGLEITPFI